MFTTSFLLTALLLTPSTLAGPITSRDVFGLSKRGALEENLANVTIHGSCNATEVRQLQKALDDTVEVARVARDYVLEHGHNDAVYKTYFGSAEPFSVIGAFDHLLSGPKDGVLLRCDNIDGNCGQEGWAGHWRGENATLETVICPLSYEIRLPNEGFCSRGYTVASHSASYYFSTDLIHRFFHVPTISNGLVGHYADEYEDVVELAVHNATWAPFNTHTLQYFAADVYARVVANPGEGCSGPLPDHDHDHDHEDESASTSESIPFPEPSTTGAETVTSGSETTTAQSSCHTHADGEVHC